MKVKLRIWVVLGWVRKEGEWWIWIEEKRGSGIGDEVEDVEEVEL